MVQQKLEFTPSYARIPLYLDYAEEALAEGKVFISGTEIADSLGTSSIQVRKDLSFAGLKGIPKRGYSTKDAVQGLRNFLTWNVKKNAFIIGFGNIAKSIISHDEFKEYGLIISHIFDNDKEKIGAKIGKLTVENISALERQAKKVKPEIAILTLPFNNEVQNIVKTLVANGVKGIWNFTKKKLVVKGNVSVHNTDFLSHYAVLSADIKMRNAKTDNE